ncbi:hypothetical protein B0H10DRAFT_2222902 [Mycena sp. CBHHK59/15]|nr:hypothetical protein B0H10DRAFT_2222902 [Mycena sp. CBHHK59/15]
MPFLNFSEASVSELLQDLSSLREDLARGKGAGTASIPASLSALQKELEGLRVPALQPSLLHSQQGPSVDVMPRISDAVSQQLSIAIASSE